MGTNYYAETSPEPKCPTCGHIGASDRLHIGKSSGGWKFDFAVESMSDDSGWLDSYAKWVAYLAQPNVRIVDEYGRETSLADLLSLVQDKQGGLPHNQNHEGYSRGYIDDGSRYQDEQGYDFMRREFS